MVNSIPETRISLPFIKLLLDKYVIMKYNKYYIEILNKTFFLTYKRKELTLFVRYILPLKVYHSSQEQTTSLLTVICRQCY